MDSDLLNIADYNQELLIFIFLAEAEYKVENEQKLHCKVKTHLKFICWKSKRCIKRLKETVLKWSKQNKNIKHSFPWAVDWNNEFAKEVLLF